MKKTASRLKLKETAAKSSQKKSAGSRKRSKSERSLNRSNHGSKECTVPGRMQLAWKPASKKTQDFVAKLLDSNICNVLNRASARSLEDIQEELSTLKLRIRRQMSRLNVPPNKLEDYGNLDNNMNTLEETLQRHTSHMERLYEESEKVDMSVERLHEERFRLQQAIGMAQATQSTPVRKQMHPLLRESTTQLNLPPLTLRGELPVVSSDRQSEVVHHLAAFAVSLSPL